MIQQKMFENILLIQFIINVTLAKENFNYKINKIQSYKTKIIN